jgi:hypothetical protein
LGRLLPVAVVSSVPEAELQLDIPFDSQHDAPMIFFLPPFLATQKMKTLFLFLFLSSLMSASFAENIIPPKGASTKLVAQDT